MDYYIGMDIGGTNIRIRAEFSDGSRPEEFLAAGCTMNTSGYERARACYQKAAGDFLKRHQLRPEDCRGLCAAVSGVDTEEEAEACRSMFGEMGFSGERIWIFNDCEILLTLTDQPALVAVAGTGSVVYGRGADGRTVRSGGWSHIISDEGSAMYMGAAGSAGSGQAHGRQLQLPGAVCPVSKPVPGGDVKRAGPLRQRPYSGQAGHCRAGGDSGAGGAERGPPGGADSGRERGGVVGAD